ncbi:MAG: glycosyltransferase [Butyrivibrio sp.]|nr:glycosyltransferase [Butyrivibrio sp.]
MRILFIMSKTQTIIGIMRALVGMGHEVAAYPYMSEDMDSDEVATHLRSFLKNSNIDFVLSNVFTPMVGELTHQLGIKYAVYGMDSPMYETYIPVYPRYDNCYLFYFDKKEYKMALEMGHGNVYYLPLAGDIRHAESLVITDEEIKKYGCDMSFVGAMYSDNPYDEYIGRFPASTQQIFTDVMEKSAFQWDGRDRLSGFLTPELTQQVHQICHKIYDHPYQLPFDYFYKELMFARKLTNIERTLLMGLLAERYDIHLYTRAGEIVPDGVKRFPEVDHQNTAYKVFYSSKININITLRSIESGIPLRIFDIMSVGGFVMTNYQEEIPELFEEGKEIATFKTPEELIEKADYYLSHDKERQQIGINGYKKIKKCYTYEHQLEKIISVLYPSH